MVDSGKFSIHRLPTEPNENKRSITITIIVVTAVGSNLTNSHESDILVKYIPKESITDYILPGLQRHLLIGIAPLCDAGYTFMFINQEVIVTKNDQVVFK